jgi:hypothetical protein
MQHIQIVLNKRFLVFFLFLLNQLLFLPEVHLLGSSSIEEMYRDELEGISELAKF